MEFTSSLRSVTCVNDCFSDKHKEESGLYRQT